jgi:hypothetical protein
MKAYRIVLLALCLAGVDAAAQQLKLNLDALAAKASNKVDISLTSQTLQFAARFLGEKDSDEAKVKKLIQGLDGIYLRSYEFNKDGAWSPADLEGVRAQLKGTEWSRIVGVDSAEDGETAEVHVRYENKKMTGIAILVAGPREVTVVNIVGTVDLDSIAELSGHFGVPRLTNKSAPKAGPKKEE